MSGNAKQRRVFRRGLTRYMDAFLTGAYGGSPDRVVLCPRLRSSAAFWTAAYACEEAARGDDPYDHDESDDYGDEEWWDDEDDRDEDGDELGCWEGGKFTRRLCPDDLCHGANRCMAKPRPWEDGDESSVAEK